MSELFKSSMEWRVLTYFLENPKKEIHASKLGRMMGISKPTANSVCKKLVEWNYLKKKNQANIVLYSLNDYNFMIKRFKTDIILDKLLKFKDIIFNEEINSIALYGSCASGEFDSKSDLDLLIITDMPCAEIIKIFEPIQKEIKREISQMVIKTTKWMDLAKKNDRFYREVLANHILIYGTPLLVG